MKARIKSIFVIAIAIVIPYCTPRKQDTFKPKEIYRSTDLIVTQITENTFVHTSFKQTDDFGNVPCNGLIARSANEVVVFDTPTTDKNAEELIRWIKETLRCKISAVVPTHFHDDCLGGLNAFHENNIPSYANFKTIELATASKVIVPQNGFQDSVVLKVGKEDVTVKFFGEGHTKDNVVGYFASENVLFGGCLIKALDASRGYLGDANLATWSDTVAKVKRSYPDVRIVVPGHGDYGDVALLDYTMKLFNIR